MGLPRHTLYIGGLPADADVETLQRLFGGISGLRSVRIVKRSSGSCRGFGYITFDNRESVYAARRMDGTPLGDTRLRIAPAR
ncbi:MAG: RNA-binding protein [Deltaproteobacteria bacterium]|nr:RNA-binding protein [Deltaproteobacteria bacterium]